jgi:hypothetical protein
VLRKNKLDSNAKVFVNLPPTIEIRKVIQSGIGSGEGGVVISSDRASANYELVGRLNSATGALEYAWMSTTALVNDNEKVRASLGKAAAPRQLMPPVSDWINANPTDQAVADLKVLALRLGKIRGWLKLPSPIAIGSQEFPYRLEIRERGTMPRILTPGEPVYAGRDYELVLIATPSSLKDNQNLMTKFWVYILNIDSRGNGNYYATGVNEKYGGMGDTFNILNPPTEIVISPKDDPLKASPPFGAEALIMLVTDREIDKNVLSFYGVRDRDLENKGEFSPLAKLLEKAGATVKSKGDISTPDTWGVQQIFVTSAARPN